MWGRRGSGKPKEDLVTLVEHLLLLGLLSTTVLGLLSCTISFYSLTKDTTPILRKLRLSKNKELIHCHSWTNRNLLSSKEIVTHRGWQTGCQVPLRRKLFSSRLEVFWDSIRCQWSREQENTIRGQIEAMFPESSGPSAGLLVLTGLGSIPNQLLFVEKRSKFN